MNDEMRTEAMELCVTACEKFSTNNEVNKFCLLQMLINLIMIVAAWIPNKLDELHDRNFYNPILFPC